MRTTRPCSARRKSSRTKQWKTQKEIVKLRVADALVLYFLSPLYRKPYDVGPIGCLCVHEESAGRLRQDRFLNRGVLAHSPSVLQRGDRP